MSLSIASFSDIKDIMSYINSEWKEGHILARDENFFKYEHGNKNQISYTDANYCSQLLRYQQQHQTL